MNKWIDYEDITGEGSNTYECSYCDFVLQLKECDVQFVTIEYIMQKLPK